MAKVELVYWKDKIGGEIGRQESKAFSYGFTIGSHGEWEMIIANEDKEVRKNETTNIKIEAVEVPAKSIALPCPIMRHALGVVTSLAGAGLPKGVEELRILNEAIFQALFDGEIKKGDLLCVINIFHAAVEQRLARGAAEKWLRERYRY